MTQTKVDKKPKNSKLRVGLIIGGAVGAFVIFWAVVIFGTVLDLMDITAGKIVTQMAKEIPTMTDVIVFSEVNDPNGVLGEPNQYTSKSSWNDSRLDSIVEDYAGTIEVFNNVKDAELREWHLNNAQELCDNTMRVDIYGETMVNATCGSLGYGTIYRDGVVVVRLSHSFDAEEIAEYREVLDEVIGKFIVVETEVPSAERVSELRQARTEQGEVAVAELKANMEAGLDEILQSYIDRLDAVAVSLDAEEFVALREELAFFKEGSYFSSKIAELEGKINEIESKIAAEERSAAEAAARAEAEKLAQKNRTFGAGNYTVCTDIDAGTYDITALSGGGNVFVHGDNYSHYVNEILYADGRYGMAKEYKNAALSCGDTLKLTSNLVVKLTAKR